MSEWYKQRESWGAVAWPETETGREKKRRIMHNSVIKYVRVSRIERYPSKRAGGTAARRDLLGNKVL